jgi:diaminohydroxyphosphoribosylaminopyrimidine deaminase/5-amino-6-(5-phosphoribosylamino)uracil reductase
MPDPISDAELQFLDRAVRLAMNGRGHVEPNPMVGCVIVKNGAIIGEGFHQKFGGPHAEPIALAACDELPAGATVYVTLEPCCHTNKKTPPCVPTLIAWGVSRVVVGCVDPNPQVSGRGIAQLREAGIQVDEVNDPAARQLIAPYVARTIHHRPYITLKWAQSADGKVAGPGGHRVQISSQRSQKFIHALRARSDAILIGIGTAIADNPLLTARDILAARPLIRIILDSDLRLSIDSQLVRTIDRGKVAIFCSKEAADYSGTRTPLAACGVEIHAVPSDAPGRLNLQSVIAEIGRMGVTHLIVEPGPTLAASFLKSGLWDRAWVIQSPKIIGDASAPSAAEMPGDAVGSVELEGDVLREYLNPESTNAGNFASADITLSLR